MTINDPLDDPLFDPAIAVDKALTADERDRFFNRFLALNPRMRGAHVADVLAILYDSDANLEVTEPFFEEHGAEIAQGQNALYASAVLALYWINGAAPTWRQVFELVLRAVPAWQAWAAEITAQINEAQLRG